MAKFTAFIALFAAMALLIANTYAYRTTVTTVEIVNDNQGSKEKCREMGGYQQLQSCKQFLMQRGMSYGVLLLDEYQKEKMNKCCRELKEVDEECRCDKLEEIVRKQQHKEELQHQMKEKARNLPAMCSLPPRRCDFY